MIQAVIYDTDGMIINREKYFSERFSEDYNIPNEKITPFFKNEFQKCMIGQADLKQEITKYLKNWQCDKSVDDLLKYWFKYESNVNQQMINSIKSIKEKGIGCYLATNNEKHRTKYLTKDLGLEKLFDNIFSSAHLACLKSEVKFWKLVNRHIKTHSKKEVLVWDNEEKNINAANIFGFSTKLFNSFNKYKKTMDTYLNTE